MGYNLCGRKESDTTEQLTHTGITSVITANDFCPKKAMLDKREKKKKEKKSNGKKTKNAKNRLCIKCPFLC